MRSILLSELSTSEGFRSSSISHTGLGGRFLVVEDTAVVAHGGVGDAPCSSSLSQVELGSLPCCGRSCKPRRLVVVNSPSKPPASCAFCSPLSTVVASPPPSWSDEGICENGRALVALFRKGLSKASLILLTLI